MYPPTLCLPWGPVLVKKPENSSFLTKIPRFWPPKRVKIPKKSPILSKNGVFSSKWRKLPKNADFCQFSSNFPDFRLFLVRNYKKNFKILKKAIILKFKRLFSCQNREKSQKSRKKPEIDEELLKAFFGKFPIFKPFLDIFTVGKGHFSEKF